LAEVSEDEWGIYENIVFTRLMDRSLQLLGWRERALAQLIERQDSAMKLSEAEDLDYRVRQELCRLWGQAWDAQPPEADDPLRKRLGELRDMSRRLRQLRFGPLYQAIARSARVPVALKNTNILMHDQHYREMREVWQLAHEGAVETHKIPPEDKIRRRMVQHQSYGVFVGLLIRHALKACKTLKGSVNNPNVWKFAGADLSLTQPHDCEWELQMTWPVRWGERLND